MKKFKLKAVLMDIDETIVTSNAGTINYYNEVLAEMIADKEAINKQDALLKIEKIENKSIRADAFFAAASLGFSMDKVLSRSLEWMERNDFSTYPDALSFIRKVHSVNIPLFTLTNNGVMSILIKLLSSGLVKKNGESFFKKFYGDDSLGDNKANPEVYKRFLEREKLDGKDVLMVGDNIEQDGYNAIKGGIKNIAIIDRSRLEPIKTEEKMIVVNSLENIIPLVDVPN